MIKVTFASELRHRKAIKTNKTFKVKNRGISCIETDVNKNLR